MHHTMLQRKSFFVKWRDRPVFERHIYEAYGLYCDFRFSIGAYDAFYAEEKAYVLLPAEKMMISEEEMLSFISYLQSVGDTSVLEPLNTIQEQKYSFIEGERVYVCLLPIDVVESESIFSEPIGAQLGMLHYNGKQMPYAKADFQFYGKWHKLWEQRLEQLERWYEKVLQETPETDVDELFLITYPYFMGLTENAIQYVVDTIIDVGNQYVEQPTICHYRFTEQTWLILCEDGKTVKCPTSFVYDHPCRDLAEWIRAQRDDIRNNWSKVNTFLQQYKRYERLTPYAHRLLYARLLFPLHYFDAIETYYRSQTIEKREKARKHFLSIVQNEHKNELFLKELPKQLHILNEHNAHRIPLPEWL